MRTHVRDKRAVTWTKIADDLGQAESTVRHWCNGTREINLSDFFRLCDAAQADPVKILFGRHTLTEEARKRVSNMVIEVLEADPAARPGYRPLTSIKRDRRKRGEP